MFKGMKIFISGGNGVIGNELVKKLHKEGAILLVGDLKDRPKDWPQDIFYRKGDLNYITKEELQDFQPEYFFHLAATFERSKETYEFWDENYKENVNLSHHLMTVIKDLDSIKKVVFASSYLIYDPVLYNFQKPASVAYKLKETDNISPRNLTGSAKLNHEIELRFLDEFRGEQIQIINARIYRSYGKNSRDIISRWVRSLLKNENLIVYNKEGLFDYIYAGEVAEGLMKLSVSDFKGTVNLGNGRARKIEEVINILKQYFPQMKYSEENSDISYEASEADMTLFRGVTGWLPEKQLEDTIPEIIEYEKNILKNPLKTKSIGNVLVTSISKKVPLLKAVKQAAQKYDSNILVYGGDISSEVIGKYFVDHFWEMPKMDKLYVEDIITYCKTENISLIIPTRDGELQFWATHKNTLQNNGILVLISSSNTVESCIDKLKFYKELTKLKLPAIRTEEDIEKLSATNRFVVKERFGAGSLNMGLNLSKIAAFDFQMKLQNPIIQPFIEGIEYSIDLYVTQEGNVKGIIVRKRSLVLNGESQITETVSNANLEKMASELALALSLRGHCVLQVLVDQNEATHIIECNSRFGGASTLSIQCGLDSFYWAIIEANGVEIISYPFARTINKKQVRFAEDVII